MSDYNSTYKRNRSRKPLKVKDLQLRLTDAIGEMERIIMTVDSDQKKIQACNSLAGLTAKYCKLMEIADFEERLERLEKINNLKKVS